MQDALKLDELQYNVRGMTHISNIMETTRLTIPTDLILNQLGYIVDGNCNRSVN